MTALGLARAQTQQPALINSLHISVVISAGRYTLLIIRMLGP